MERGVKVEQVQSAIDLCKSNGIQTGMFLMWGYEGEEPQDIEATIEHVKRSDPDIFLTTVSYPIKGTPYFERVAGSLVQLKPWEATTDRDFVIRGRRSRRFYDYADQLLRDEVRLARIRRIEQPDSAEEELRSRVREWREGLYATAAEVEA